MQFEIKETEHATVVTLGGHFSEIGEDFEALKQNFKDLIDAAKDVIGFNMAGVDFIDSSTIGLLVQFHQNCQEKGKNVIMFDLSENVAEVFDLTNLNKIFNILDTEGDFSPLSEGGAVPYKVSFQNVNVTKLITEVEVIITEDMDAAKKKGAATPGEMDDSELDKLMQQLDN